MYPCKIIEVDNEKYPTTKFGWLAYLCRWLLDYNLIFCQTWLCVSIIV